MQHGRLFDVSLAYRLGSNLLYGSVQILIHQRTRPIPNLARQLSD